MMIWRKARLSTTTQTPKNPANQSQQLILLRMLGLFGLIILLLNRNKLLGVALFDPFILSLLLKNFGGKGLPNMSSIIKQFRDVFDWVDANSTGHIIPLEGADVEYDSASKKIEEIESDLKKHILEQKKLLGITSVMDTLLIKIINFLIVSYVLH
ncbi:uncharacterized protein LOC110736074 [Chenopodium quinoa]|uniref:uncharacterized protein LOC110736074 n=1 Tax=Chenopodium quinoa TaxID=63459 RepID=UPI000B77B6C4|nr:uncharacterized protein LOC110736074 [Chenopodium quinoa]